MFSQRRQVAKEKAPATAGAFFPFLFGASASAHCVPVVSDIDLPRVNHEQRMFASSQLVLNLRNHLGKQQPVLSTSRFCPVLI